MSSSCDTLFELCTDSQFEGWVDKVIQLNERYVRFVQLCESLSNWPFTETGERGRLSYKCDALRLILSYDDYPLLRLYPRSRNSNNLNNIITPLFLTYNSHSTTRIKINNDMLPDDILTVYDLMYSPDEHFQCSTLYSVPTYENAIKTLELMHSIQVQSELSLTMEYCFFNHDILNNLDTILYGY